MDPDGRPAEKRCEGCEQEFTADEVVEIGGRTLCARCKQEAVRDIKSGVTDSSICPPEVARKVRREILAYSLVSVVFGVPGFLWLSGAGLNRLVLMDQRAYSLYQDLPGAVLLSIAVALYAKGKGRSGYWGFLGGLFCIGLIAINFLKKRCRYCDSWQEYAAGKCRQCECPL